MSRSPQPVKANENMRQFVREALSVTLVEPVERMQSLWGEQGQILRLRTDSPVYPTCVLKHISLNPQAHHPRGWNTGTSFQRKATSYEVERCWYESFADRCGPNCKVPQCLGTHTQEGESYILLEDLSEHYPLRCDQLSVSQAQVCLEWLARFHARFLGDDGQGLWPEGCYWHLNTRADELNAMPEGPLKQAAKALDQKLASAQYQTLIHGDAKVANFCFSESLEAVSAVDFQYVGRGCGMKDVVYFLGSCLPEKECAENETILLNMYFNELGKALNQKLSTQKIREIEFEWRSLYGVAWTDFYRFLMGWMPTHPKINTYTQTLCEKTLSDLQNGRGK